MKKKTKMTTLICMSLILSLQAMPAKAAENAQISLNANSIEADSKIRISCDIDSMSDVTSGKLRIRYDNTQLTILSTSAESTLSDALCQLNDPLTGNREPGEIILVFASAQPIEHQGSLLEMEFQASDNLKEGDQINISVEAEQLSSDSGNVDAVVKPSSIIVGKNTDNPPDDNSPKDPAVSEKPSISDKDASGTTGINMKKDLASVKTGDSARILFPLFGLAGAGIATTIVICKKKRLN